MTLMKMVVITSMLVKFTCEGGLEEERLEEGGGKGDHQQQEGGEEGGHHFAQDFSLQMNSHPKSLIWIPIIPEVEIP